MSRTRAVPLDGELTNLVGQCILAQRLQGVCVRQQVLRYIDNLLDGVLALGSLVCQ